MSSSPVCSPNFAFPTDKGTDYFSISNGRKLLFKNKFNFHTPDSMNKIHSDATISTPDSIIKITSTTSDLSIDETPSKRVCRNELNDEIHGDYFTNDFGRRGGFHSSSHSDTTAEATSAADLAIEVAAENAADDSQERLLENDHIRALSAIEPCFPFRPHRDTFIPMAETAPPQKSFTSNSVYGIAHGKPPPMKKQLTLPALSRDLSFNSIKNDQIRRIHSLLTTNYKEQIIDLSPSIHYHPPTEMNSMLRNEERNEISAQNQTQNRLLIDIRPFTDFVQSHLCSSVNLCIPSTLLKRPNFNLQRCINSLPENEKLLIWSFFEVEKPGVVIVYDHSENSSNLFHICNKFIASSLFNSAIHSIHLVDTSFTQFHDAYPTLFESGTSEMNSGGRTNQSTGTDPSAGYPGAGPASSLNYAAANVEATLSRLNNILPPIIVGKPRSISMANITQEKLDFSSAATPILLQFSLPKATTLNFKIRHNEELLTSNPFEFTTTTSKLATLAQNKIKFFKLNNLPSDKMILPKWLRDTTYEDNKVNTNFFALEKLEQARLINALSLNKELVPVEECVTISRGIEFGHKNRYKDIFLFEHSRVKLNNGDDVNDDEDYINASYLNPITNLGDLTNITPSLMNHLKSVATQGPLEQTMGDFWKCIFISKSVVIISLTDEIENGVIKCSPFWKSGVYISNKDTLNVKLHKEHRVNEFLTLRSFHVSMDGQLHKVMQLHLTSWPDMGIVLKPLDLIQLLQLKAYIVNNVNIERDLYPTIIHCSAGCGRTGTLCTIDTVLNILKNNVDLNLAFDPIYDIVNNFRRQRISMVQNLGQYFLIYEIILEYVLNVNNKELVERSRWDDLCKLEIVEDFVLD